MCRMASEVDGTWQKLGVKICSVCQFKASDDGVFRSHVCRKKKNQIAIRFKKQLNIFVCSTCKIERNRFDFTEHLQCHLQEKPFKCSYCDDDFETKYGIFGHFILVHPSMPKTYKLKVQDDTEKYLEMAENKGLAFVTSIRTRVALESLQTVTATMQMLVDINNGCLPISQSSCIESSTSRGTASLAQSFQIQSSNDMHTRFLHSIDNIVQSYPKMLPTSESPEAPLMHQISGSNTKDIHKSTIHGKNNPSSFATSTSQISVTSVDSVVTQLSKAEIPILHANLSCSAGTRNNSFSTGPHDFISPAIAVTTSLTNEGPATQKASVPSGDRLSQSRSNPQTSEPPVISSTTQLPTKKVHDPLSVPYMDKVSRTSVSPSTITITQLTSKDPSSPQNSSFPSGDRLSPSYSICQTSLSPAVFLETQPLKVANTLEKPPCPQRSIKSESHLDPRTTLSTVHSITTQPSKDGHSPLSCTYRFYGTNSLSQYKQFDSSINHFNVKPSMSTGVFVPLNPPLNPGSSVKNASQLGADPQTFISPTVSMTPKLTACRPVYQIHQDSSAFQECVPHVMLPANQSSKRMPNLVPFPRPSGDKGSQSVVSSSRTVLTPSIHLNVPSGDKGSQSVVSSSRTVLTPSIHLNARASREIPTLAKSLCAAKDDTTQSCVVQSVQQASVTHEKVCSSQQNSLSPTARLSGNEQDIQCVHVQQPGSIDLRIVKTDCDPKLKLPEEEEKFSKDIEYSFLNIFYVNNEIIFVCSKCKVKFKERAPFFLHIWKNHAHTPGDSHCCSSIFNESCTHLQRIIKLLNNKAMGLFNIQLEKNQLSACTNDVFSSVEDDKVPLLSVQEQPLSSLKSTDSEGTCQPNLSKCLGILSENPNCITQLQIKVKEIDGGTRIEEDSMIGLPTAIEMQAKAQEVHGKNDTGGTLAINNSGCTEVGISTNSFNQLCDTVTSNAVKICEDNTGSNISISLENFEIQNEKASEIFFSAIPPTSMNNGNICQPNLSRRLEILTGDPDCITQLQTTIEERHSGIEIGEDSLTGPPPTKELQAKTKELCEENCSDDTLNVNNLGEKEVEVMRNPTKQLCGVLNSDLSAKKLSEQNIGSKVSSDNFQSEIDKASENLFSGKDVNKSKENVNPKIRLQKDDHKVECSVTFKSTYPAKGDTVLDIDIAHPPDTEGTFKGLINNLMTKYLATENEMPVSAVEDDDENQQLGHEPTEIKRNDENRENSSNTLLESSAFKRQSVINELKSKNSQEDALHENIDSSHVDHFHEQLMSDVDINLRETREGKSTTDLHSMIVQEADEEKGHTEPSMEVLQQLTAMNTEEASCAIEEAGGSKNAQIEKDSRSVTQVTQLTSNASKSEIDHTKITASNHGSSEFGDVHNAKSAKDLEQTKDKSKSPSLEKSLKITDTEKSNDTLSNFFKCAFSHCDFSSCLPVDLLTHDQEVHGMECTFSCFYCGFEAKSTSELLHHMDFHLDLTCDSYSGTIWKNSFTEKIKKVENKVLGTTMNAVEYESRNIENVGYSCNFCEMRFTSLKALGCHFEESTLRTYSCRYCRAHFLDSKSAEKHIREEHPKSPLFRRQHRKLLCKDRVLNKESFSKLSTSRQSLRKADTSNDVNGEANKVMCNNQRNCLRLNSSNVIEYHSLTFNKPLTEMKTNEEVHTDKSNISGHLSASERNGSEDNERREDMSSSQMMLSSSQLVKCHVSKQLETENEVGPLLNLDESIPNHCHSSMKDFPAFEDGNSNSCTVKESDLSVSVASESEPVVMENNQLPLALHKNSESGSINTNLSPVPQTSESRDGVTTVKGKNFRLLEKLSTPDFAVSKFPSNKPKKMPRIYDLCAEKNTADRLSSLYSQIQDRFYSCNSCHKKFQRLRSMLCHIFFCQGKISVVNCPYSCTFGAEHPKIITKHIQEKHPKKDPKCKSFRCINVNMFFKYLKDKQVNQVVMEKACEMQNGHTTEKKTFKSKIKKNTFKDKREALTYHPSSEYSEGHLRKHENSGDKNGALDESQIDKIYKVTESDKFCENQGSLEMKVLKVKKRSHDMSISQSKTSKISLAAEAKSFKGNSPVSMVESEGEMNSLHKSHINVEAQYLDKTLPAHSVTVKQGMETETKKMQVDPPSKDINSVGNNLLFDKNSLYQCKLCQFVSKFDIDCMKKHIGEKHFFFACGYCERPYYNLSILKNHIRFAHNKSPPKFQQVSPELIFTRVDSTATETSLDDDITSQNEENRETMFEGSKPSQVSLPNQSCKNLDTVSPNNICKDFPGESYEKNSEKDVHSAKSTSSVLKANDLNCQQFGEIYFGSTHGKDGKGSNKGAQESCCTQDFVSHIHSLPRSNSLGKQTLNDTKPQSIDIIDMHKNKNSKENLNQIVTQEQSKVTPSPHPEQNPSTSEGSLFPGSKGISLKRKANEVLHEDFLYNQQQHMKKRCCDKLVHEDTWEMETRCGADLSATFSQQSNHQQVRVTSSEYAHEVNNPRPKYGHEVEEPSTECALEAKKPSDEAISMSYCTALETTDNCISQQHLMSKHFTIGGLNDKMIGQSFTCKNCMISLPSVSEMKMHFAKDHFNKNSHWFDQRMETDYSSVGEKLYHKTDDRPSVTRYLCGYCIFQSPMKESISKHMASAHNSMEYHFVQPATEGDLVAYTERCCVTDEEEAGIACKHEMPAADKSRPKLRYRCHLCDTHLNSEFLFRLHLAKHGGFKYCSALPSARGLLLCAICGYVASSSHDLGSHVNRHMTERRFSCSYCGFDDHKRKGVYIHIRKYHGDGSSAYAVDNERQKKDVDMRPKLVDLSPVVCVTEINC